MSRSAGSIFPVIMAGGSGTRFWPLSRKAKPKQFLPLATRQPLISDTAARLKGLVPMANCWVVCGKQHAPAVRKLVKGLPAKNVLVEPMARNTAPAIALATVHVARRNPQGILVVLPSDQHVAQVPGFVRAVQQAARVAEQGSIVTLGIRPTRPETGYGYIRLGAAMADGAHRVAAFVEKPDLPTAKGYLASQDYLWNAGIFVFRADVMLRAFEQHMPELFAPLTKIQAAIGKATYARVLAKAFAQMPATSIDYGVAEKADNMAVVPGDFGWSDVGSFNALPEVRPTDERGNVVLGDEAMAIDCEGCVLVANKKPLAVVGMREVVVVDAGDALLVLPKDRSQDVRQVVEALKRRKREQYL